MAIIKFGLRYLKKDIYLAILAEILSFLGIFAELLLPLLTGILVDYVIKDTTVDEGSGGLFHFLLTGKFGEVHTLELFWWVAIVFACLVAVRIILIYIRDLIQEKIGLRLETALRYATYDKLMELDSETISKYNSGELLQILNSDTITFKELFAHRMAYFGDSIFMLVTTIILISTINISFIVLPLIICPFLVKILINFKKRALYNFEQIRKSSSLMNLAIQENVAGVRIVRSFTNENLEKEKFNEANKRFYDTNYEQVKLTSNFDMEFNIVKQIANIGTILIGSLLVMSGRLTVGYILSSSTYVTKLMAYITSVNNNIFNMQQQAVAGFELDKFLQRESEIKDNKGGKLKLVEPNIELKNVNLTIDGQKILKDINLSIPYGKKLGVVGETGSGKSALLKTIVRIKDISDGSITIDGHDIKDISLKYLRDMFSFVFQDVFLFSNTIESNIAFAKPDADARLIKEAAVHAKADGFINRLSEKYQTIVGERGLGISGGQKQRVSIARCFLKNAPIFVLDDSTSALDIKTEKTLLENIREQFYDKTIIITAHRFSSVVDCDEIIYMEDGEIVERGTFEELIKMNKKFAHVYAIQMQQKDELMGGVKE